MLESSPLPFWPVLAAALGVLLPWGAAFVASDEARAVPSGLMALIAWLITLLGMAATGFALAYGGIGIPIDHPDLAALVWEWTPLREGELAFWGVAGWMGFGMHGAQTPLAAWLFLASLPGVATAAVLTMAALWQRLLPLMSVILASMIAFFLAPLTINWTQGGGWLMHLGRSVGAGEGFIDAGGAAFFLLPGGAALAALFIPRRRIEDVENGVGPGLGAGLLLAGGAAWLIASPLPLWSPLTPLQALLNAFLAAAAGGLIGLAYGWVVHRYPAVTWMTRGTAAGFIASLAPLQLIQPMQAMLVGAMAAWLYILVNYLLIELLHRDDPGDVFSAFGLAALWGVLAVGFFAHAPGQMRAQLIGGVSILLMGFLAVFLLQFPLALVRSWRTRRARPLAGGLSAPAAEETGPN